MGQKAKIFKSALQIMAFCILASKGCSFIGTLLASLKKKKTLLLLNQILKEKRLVKPSKSIIEEKIVLKPSKNIIEEKIVEVKPSKSINHKDVDRAMKIHFPEEIIVDILSRLPVRSLLRFKCASKFWKSLISEPHFKTKHWNHAKNNKKFQKLLIGRMFPTAYDKRVGTISYYCSSLSSAQLVEGVQKLGCPSNDKPCGYIMLCCCDGLSLLWSHGDHLLWNPSTNESAVLPNPEFPPVSGSTYGMGYDSTIDDYKIFKIDDNMGYGSNPPSKILALKSGSWRKIDNHPRGFRNSVSGKDSLAFIHGAFHWISMDIL
uniref:F-box protein CPR30 n=2 Tax=Nicotiana TaxID=4085 RepID=A0A1S3Y2V0_TOBAC|nr:PREDICTED: F-box protein CPR30-like [Nicotiana tabacum]